mmetsp:Transcript_23986/g.47652  ORF Transcript_23986/g.47652 Transcript_23986/m.47652 type:complete len:94 (+) Transcript_23986:83-364(+)
MVSTRTSSRGSAPQVASPAFSVAQQQSTPQQSQQRHGEKKSKSHLDLVSVGSPPLPSLDVCVLNIDHCDCVCVHHFDLIQSHPSSIEQKTVKF